MKLARCFFAVTTVLPAVFGADWIRLSTPNFEMYASCPEEEAREMMEIFEEARDFFSRTEAVQGTSTVPVKLVIFGSAKEYQQYSNGPSKPAYFVPTELGDFVVMSDLKSFDGSPRFTNTCIRW